MRWRRRCGVEQPVLRDGSERAGVSLAAHSILSDTGPGSAEQFEEKREDYEIL